ncbi:MAG: restriction endonuclease, partial [Thermosynechococcaceae cyanobacterium]
VHQGYDKLPCALAQGFLLYNQSHSLSRFKLYPDKLGLDVVYIQAKRWDNTPVGRPDVMQFAGALQAQRANKGIFITTSRFTDDARNYVSQIGSKIVLIDGEQLTSLMIENDVGVSTVSMYPVKKIDNDYFDESI